MGNMSWAGEQPARQLRAPRPDDELPPRRTTHSASKNHCRKKGIPHQLALRIDPYIASLIRYPRQHGRPWTKGCGWVRWHWPDEPEKWKYRCYHQQYCTTCGKILFQRLKNADCPDYAPRAA